MTRRSARGRRQGPRSPVRVAVVAVVAVLAGCTEVRDSVTAPAGPQAADIAWLWWFFLALGVLVYVAVMALLVVPLVRSRRRRRGEVVADGPAAPPDRPERRPPAGALDEPLAVADPALAAEARGDERARSRLVWLGGIVVPVLILTTLLVASSSIGARVAHVEEEGELVIDVIGHMFWWEVVYPDLDITTANELAVPIDRPVRLRLTTDDVIHSFWIPRLHGKVDMVPGRENWLSFTATETGSFRGHCAEFCGIAHAQMVKFVEAMEPEDFDAWVEQQQTDASGPQDEAAEAGERIFLDVGCAACHAVRGTAAVGGVGPDLTHLASRRTLAAGIVPNTREHLSRLIVDPWGLKPGNPMPPTELSDDDLDDLIAYLEGLE